MYYCDDRMVTVPPVTRPLLHPMMRNLYPITTPLFFLFARGHLCNNTLIQVDSYHISFLPVYFRDMPLWFVVFIVGLLISFVLLKFYPSKSYRPTPEGCFLLATLVGSFTWIYLIISLIINAIQLLRSLSNLSELILGMTIMAMGNSVAGNLILVDISVDTILASQGY